MQLRKLKEKIDEFGEGATKSIQIRSGKVVYLYRQRFKNKAAFVDHIEKCIHAADNAANELETVFERAIGFDIGHIETVMLAASELDRSYFDNLDFMKFLRQLQEFSVLIRFFGAAIKLGTNISGARQGRGRPALPYTLAALDLIEVWEDLTGTQAVSPKGKAKAKEKREEKAVRIRLKFVHLGLQMMDLEVTLPIAITSIKNALKLIVM